MDFAITVCDCAAGETYPVWPGHPATAYWGIEDPAAVEGSEIKRERAFVQAAKYLKTRVSLFLNLPLASLDKISLASRLREIGHTEGSTRGPTVAMLRDDRDAKLRHVMDNVTLFAVRRQLDAGVLRGIRRQELGESGG